ncbi:MAG: outer membrane protein TolC, partial [Saprospiraceae bacterium]
MGRTIRSRNFVLAFLLCFCITSICQGQTKSIELTCKEFLDNLLKYHPIAKQANLRLDLGAVALLAAKGNLDPVVSADWNQKNFDDKLYYRQYQAKLKFPTKLGIDVVGGYENTEGVFLNPENSTDDFGLWYIGVEVNVLQGLIVNERKIALEQAKVFQDLVKNEQRIALNELLHNAFSAYFLWQEYYYSKVVLTENISIANTYFDNTKQTFEGGEKTAMDTLEAFILYQDAIAFLQKNELDLIDARQKVENYLWYDEAPVALQENTIPEDYKNAFFSETVNFENPNLSSHPVILAAINKLSYFEIEQKLKREKLKPKLQIKYNPLLTTSENSIAPNFSATNYKWGFDFSMPLLLRTERADIQRGEIKLRETALGIQNKRNELQNKIESSLQQQALLL